MVPIVFNSKQVCKLREKRGGKDYSLGIDISRFLSHPSPHLARDGGAWVSAQTGIPPSPFSYAALSHPDSEGDKRGGRGRGSDAVLTGDHGVLPL